MELDGKTLPTVTETKFLGLSVDSKLNWNTHVNILTSNKKRHEYVTN